MTNLQLREELLAYIHRADDHFIQLVYSMMQANLDEEDFRLSEEHQAIIDKRIAAHQSSPLAGANWQIVKEKIEKKL